ncbi:MAG: hypothetical protein WC661_11865 [Opitutaceae bacterium]|jgi:hypothetical protein
MKKRTLTDADVDAIAARVVAMLPGAHEIAELREDFAELRRIIIAATVGRPSRAEQAKKAGVSTATIYRREKALKTRLLLHGRFGL